MSAVEYPITIDPDDLIQAAFAALQDTFPGWQPAEGNLDVLIIEAAAGMASEVAQVAADVPPQIMEQVGALFGVEAHPATAATSTVSFDVIDDDGHVIPAGTLLDVSDTAGGEHGFTTDADLTIPAGAVSGSVPITATEPGAASSGIDPADGNTVCVDALGFVQTTRLLAPTVGGVDAETSDAYLARLAAALQLLAPRPILPDDFAALARQVDGVGRALAIDLYEPGPPINTTAPRTVSVVVTDAAGEPCLGSVKAEADALLQAAREVNFVVHVIDPTYTTVTVAATIVVRPGYSPADVGGRTDAAIEAYLSPALWGADPTGDDPGAWRNQPTVRYLDVAAQILAVDGVDHISALTVNGGSADVNLPGPGALPRGTATVTAT